jgi:hypothetical protein
LQYGERDLDGAEEIKTAEHPPLFANHLEYKVIISKIEQLLCLFGCHKIK